MTAVGVPLGQHACKLALLPGVLTALLWLTRVRETSLVSVACSCALLTLAWSSYLKWKAGCGKHLPLFCILAAMYWAYYFPPMFWVRHPGAVLAGFSSSPALDHVAIMVIVGAFFLGIGMRSGLGRRCAPRSILLMHPQNPAHWQYVRLILVAGIPLSLVGVPANAGAGGRQAAMLLASTVPVVAFVLLFRRCVQRRGSLADRCLVVAFSAARSLAVLSSGSLGPALGLIVICAAVLLWERRKLPVLPAVLVLVAILFLQPGKGQFREIFWSSRVEAGPVQRLFFWADASWASWRAAFDRSSTADWHAVAEAGVGRLSLLHQSAQVLELTPSVVPYQYGRLYAYLAVTFIPRALWPGKPSVNEANRFYQVAYGLTRESDLNSVSISVGVLAESYINFGWCGVVVVMFMLGVLFEALKHTLFSTENGHVLNAIGLALIPGFTAIESQMAQYVGGVAQSVIVILLVLAPILHRDKVRA